MKAPVRIGLLDLPLAFSLVKRKKKKKHTISQMDERERRILDSLIDWGKYFFFKLGESSAILPF